MSATKPDNLTLALQKTTEGFTAIVYRPTDNNIFDICQLLVPVLMKTKYNNLALTNNISEIFYLPSVTIRSKRKGLI